MISKEDQRIFSLNKKELKTEKLRKLRIKNIYQTLFKVGGLLTSVIEE